MPVSYLSKPLRSSAYVPPIDLGLFAKVLGTKQQQSDLNAQKEQASIDQLGSLDVIRDSDRTYLNEKINNLVASANNFGGQDFADPSVFNQIEGLGSDIYSDNKIISAVASTKQVRKLTAGYEKYRTDPKFSKLYGPQNEAWDMRKVNEWMQNPEVGASYQGPSAPTPYVPYRDSHAKIFDKIVADKYEKDSYDGFYINRTTNERVAPDRVWAEAEELMLPQERDQIKKDGWFLYTQTAHLAPEDIIRKGLTQVGQRFNDTKYLKDYYESQANAAVSDPAERMRYNALANQKASELVSLSKDPLYTTDAAIKSFTQDPDEFMYQVYKNDYFKGLASRYSVNKTSVTTRPDQVAMYADRKAQAEKQFDEKMAQDDKQFYDRLSFDYFKEGLKMIIDPKTRAIKGVPIMGQGGTGPSSTTINTQNPEDVKITNNSLKQMSDSLDLEKQAEYDKLVEDFAAHHPELGFIVPSLGGTGHHRELIGQKFLEGVNQKPGLQLDDFKGLQDNAVQGQIKGAFQQAGVQDVTKSMELLTRFYNNYQTILDGNGKTVGELPPEFIATANNVQLINERQRGINLIQKQAGELVTNQTGWSQSKKDLFNDYLAHRDKYEGEQSVSIPGQGLLKPTVTYGSRKIDALKEDLRKQGIDPGKIIDQFYGSLSTRDVFQTHIFSNTDAKVTDGTIPTFMAAELAAGHGSIYSGGKKYENTPYNVVDVTKIKPIQTGMMADGTGRFFIQGQISQGEGKDATLDEVIIPLSDSQAASVGLQRDPLENLNFSVNLTGRSGDMSVYGNNNLAVTVQVQKKNLRSLNDYSSFASVKVFSKDQNGNRIPNKFTLIEVPGSNGLTPADAFRAANDIIQTAAQADEALRKNGQPGISTETFINWLIQNRKQ